MAEHQTIADVYARMKAREEAQHVLDANKPGRAPRAAGEGALAGSLPVLLTGAVFSAGPQTQKFLKSRAYELPFEAREAQKGTAGPELDAAKKSIKGIVQARINLEDKHGKLSELTAEKVSKMSEGERKTLKTVLDSWANLKENKLPDFMPVPKGEALREFGHAMKGPALMALIPAALGALGGYTLHQKNLKRRERLLQEAGLKKSASESVMEISVTAQQAFWSEVEAIQAMQKIAAEEEDPSWLEKQKGQYRAMRAGDKGVDLLLAHPDLVGQRVTKGVKGAATGGLIGVPIGALLGLLAAKRGNKAEAATLGAALGTLGIPVGQTVGQMEADRKWLADKGITQTYGGLSAEFSPEAKAKYIKKTASTEDIGVRIMQAAFRDEMQKIALSKEAGLWSGIKGALGMGGGSAAAKGLSAAEHSAINAAGEAAQNARFGKPREVIGAGAGPAGPSAEEVRQRILAARGGNVSGREAVNLDYLKGPAAARQQAAVAAGSRRGDMTPLSGFGTNAGPGMSPMTKAINPQAGGAPSYGFSR